MDGGFQAGFDGVLNAVRGVAADGSPDDDGGGQGGDGPGGDVPGGDDRRGQACSHAKYMVACKRARKAERERESAEAGHSALQGAWNQQRLRCGDHVGVGEDSAHPSTHPNQWDAGVVLLNAWSQLGTQKMPAQESMASAGAWRSWHVFRRPSMKSKRSSFSASWSASNFSGPALCFFASTIAHRTAWALGDCRRSCIHMPDTRCSWRMERGNR